MYDPTGYTGTHIQAVLERMEREQSWLARHMGVSPSLVSMVLAGRKPISRNFVVRACRVLGLPEAALFIGSPAMLASKANMSESNVTEVAS